MARDVLDALPESMKSSQSSLSSSEFAYDFLDDNSQFGSQLNLRTVYSEFDDMPGFVDGKVLYYIKGCITQPYSVGRRLIHILKHFKLFDQKLLIELNLL